MGRPAAAPPASTRSACRASCAGSRRRRRWAAGLLAACLAGGAAGGAAADRAEAPGPQAASAATAGAAVQILSIHPPTQQTLHPGQRLRVVVEVAYAQPGEQATLALGVQEGAPGQRPLVASLTRVTQRRGVVTLSAELYVPAVPQLQVYVPLYLREGEPTTLVDMRRYRVDPGP